MVVIPFLDGIVSRIRKFTIKNGSRYLPVADRHFLLHFITQKTLELTFLIISSKELFYTFGAPAKISSLAKAANFVKLALNF